MDPLTSPCQSRVGRPRLNERAERHETILDAATAVFLEQGFSGASTAEIARRAGASKQTLYTLFPSKATLFAALMTRRSGKMTDQFAEEAVRPDAEPAEVLCRYGLNLLSTMLCEDTCRLHRVLVAEAPDFPELAAAFWENGPGRGREVLKQYLASLSRRGVLRIESIDDAAEQLFGALLCSASLRACLQLPPLLPDQQAIAHWVRSGVDAFLRAHRAR
jgi:AcrR family transcriptional regulator